MKWVIGWQPLRSDKVEFENYELAYVRYKVRKDVPKSKAKVEVDWNTFAARVVEILLRYIDNRNPGFLPKLSYFIIFNANLFENIYC